jgi:hypothetical protein
MRKYRIRQISPTFFEVQSSFFGIFWTTREGWVYRQNGKDLEKVLTKYYLSLETAQEALKQFKEHDENPFPKVVYEEP